LSPQAASSAVAVETPVGEIDPEAMSEDIEAQIRAYNEYYPPATFDAMVTAMQKSWRTIILSRGKQVRPLLCVHHGDMYACPALPSSPAPP
jgi:geranylgeranyl pyrophosphate synthase